eukprot:TRINITY_DN5987_c0_g1_i3.p1 TRINITY_DN5987_c0_g1~~TRINITY_DN5987_c0_g1_i3.p1  ORF type:complete len:602 (+),score=128.65 TRINITY_DN5987_c0_g1_i3:2-1807(+)
MAHPSVQLIGFGEAMIRFAPMPNAPTLADPTASVMLRSVGGDELNVTVAAARLMKEGDAAPQWISVLPEGPMGDLVHESGAKAGVDLQHIVRVANADIGTFTVIPEMKQVHYQRRQGAFAQQAAHIFNWDKILDQSHQQKWLHMTGITPMISLNARLAWTQALNAAYHHNVPVSMDFNHRKQLGTLVDLWSVMSPHLTRLDLLILSVGSMVELAELEGMHDNIPAAGTPLHDQSWLDLLAALNNKWHVKRLAVCFKTRDEQGLQRRWSALVDSDGVHTTYETPVYHKPKDECGGGSAWAAGMLDCLYSGTNDVTAALRRADLLAGLHVAMCQETAGDHSQVTREQLDQTEAQANGKAINLEELGGNAVAARIDETFNKLKSAGVLAIIRAKNPDAAIKRGIELCELGCRAIEVTLDTVEWRRVLKTIIANVPESVCVGVGTAMDVDVPILKEIADMGARFALSPIEPKGFIDECHRVGLLAVPAGMTSNELWDMHRRGARIIKLFHASLVGFKILKSMLGVSPLAAMNIAPSGGCSPDNAAEWWDAGAVCIGMGSNLSGKDISCPAGTSGYEAGVVKWKESGRETAKKLFQTVAQRFPLEQ